MRIGIYTGGKLDAQVNLEERRTQKGMLEFYGAGTLFQLNDATSDFSAFEVIFEPSYLEDLLGGDMPAIFRMKASSISVELDDEEWTNFSKMMRLLLVLSKAEGALSPVTRSMAQTVLRYTTSLFRKYLRRDKKPLMRQEIIFQEFAHLVTTSHGRQRRHKYYADQLNVSEHYLSLAVKRSSGITAKEWIDRVVMAEIKLMLVHSDLTIAQIAYKLDFPSDSFLCRFFRRHEAMSPLEFRRAYMY